jgi:hypothetical protein
MRLIGKDTNQEMAAKNSDQPKPTQGRFENDRYFATLASGSFDRLLSWRRKSIQAENWASSRHATAARPIE